MRIRELRRGLVAVLMATALAISVCAVSGTARAAPALTSARAAGAASQGTIVPVTPPGLAPCVKPLPGPVRQCESTSPLVNRWFNVTGSSAAACAFRFKIDWGDGTPDWTGTVTDPGLGERLLAAHVYKTSKTVVNYTETVYSSVLAGSCTPPPTTQFGFTYMPPFNPQSWWEAVGISKACAADLAPHPGDVGLTLLDLGQTLGVFAISGGWGVVFEVVKVVVSGKAVWDVLFKAPKDCVDKAYSLGPLPKAFAYGASHLGKLFQPKKGTELKMPQITSVSTYTSGVLDYFRLAYSDPGRDAKGFGFVGINGAGWAEENHPFTAPSYGIVGKDQIDYPFNLLCGTTGQYSSRVEAWIYNSQGVRSYPVQVALKCT
jgi:hypothetical protein